MDMGNDKQPFKMIEIPLMKFSEEVIPHHQQIFEQHKTLCQKLISANNVPGFCQEVKNKGTTVRQVKDLMYELDTLRAHVEDSDLDRFDSKTLSLRKVILNIINGYRNLEDTARDLAARNQPETEEGDEHQQQHPFENVGQLQVDTNIKFEDDIDRLDKIEAIEEDVKDLNEIYIHLNEMVGDQRQSVEHIEESIESTSNNVYAGLRNLIKAHKLKASAYSATGALLGGMIGGPIGLVAGLKVGGLTALGCAVAGYTGGRYLKKLDSSEADVSDPAQSDQQQKQDIICPESSNKKEI